MKESSNSQKICEKGGQAHLSYKDLSEVGQDVRPDLFTMTREHCPGDKASVNEDKDGRTDSSNSPKICKKGGQV